jgi:hypothetical protein
LLCSFAKLFPYAHPQFHDDFYDEFSKAHFNLITPSDFCTSGCTDKTANFIKGLFGHLDKARACPDAVTFCGGCAAKAAHYMQNRKEIPCCLRAVVVGPLVLCSGL